MEKEQTGFKKLLSIIGKVFSITITTILVTISLLLVFYVTMFVYNHTTGQTPRFSLYRIISESMEPYINKNDIIINVRVDDLSTVEIDDVITFRSSARGQESKVITHRVIEIVYVDGDREFKTRGDANAVPDPNNVREDDLIGTVVFRIPLLGYLQQFFSTPLRLILFLLVPVILIIFYDIGYLGWLATLKKRADKFEESDVDLEELERQEEDKKIEETIEQIKKSVPIIIESEPEEELDSSLEVDAILPEEMEALKIMPMEEVPSMEPIEEVIPLEIVPEPVVTIPPKKEVVPIEIIPEPVVVAPPKEEVTPEEITEPTQEEEIIDAAIARMKKANKKPMTLFEESSFIDFGAEEPISKMVDEDIHFVGKTASYKETYQVIGDDDAYVFSPNNIKPENQQKATDEAQRKPNRRRRHRRRRQNN